MTWKYRITLDIIQLKEPHIIFRCILLSLHFIGMQLIVKLIYTVQSCFLGKLSEIFLFFFQMLSTIVTYLVVLLQLRDGNENET